MYNLVDCPHLSQMEEEILNNKYKIIDKRKAKGGAYGVVNKAINLQNNQFVAIKELRQTVGNNGITSTVIRELSILDVLKDKHIVQLIETFNDGEKIYLVFPYISRSLDEFMEIEHKNAVPEKIVKQIIKQLLQALRTAHSARFMHRDIKPQNIMVEVYGQNPQDFTIKLADWGSARKLNICKNQQFTEEVIPLAYRPPQLLIGTKVYTQTVDIWSLGSLFAELLLKERIFKNTRKNSIMTQILQTIGLSQSDDYDWMLQRYRDQHLDIPEQINSFRGVRLDLYFQKNNVKITPACDLIKKMLRINPERRISAIDSLKHEYFDSNN